MAAIARGWWPHLCVAAVVAIAALALAEDVEDPTPGMIRKAMMPTAEDVAGNPPVLRVGSDKARATAGETLSFHAELHNTSSRYMVVYMPGLTGREEFVSDKKDLRVDEYGPPQVWGRFAHKDERQDFVVLMPGDYCGRSYTWTAPDAGKVVFVFRYKNEKGGEHLGVQAWTGQTAAARSEPVLVAAPK